MVARYEKKAQPDAPQHNAKYAAMIQSLDENVGLLMKSLADAGVAEKTVVIFTGDNGRWLPSTNTNLGSRAGKGSAYEGGVRVPLIVHWPGVTKPGSVCHVPVIGVNLYPTVLEMSGLSAQDVDGVSIVPLLREGGSARNWHRDSIYWHYPTHYHPGGATPYSAIRYREWKLIEFQEGGRLELYNLSATPARRRI